MIDDNWFKTKMKGEVLYLDARSNNRGVAEALQSKICQSSHCYAERKKFCPVSESKGKPSEERVGNWKITDVSWQVYTDYIGQGLHNELFKTSQY